MLLCRRVAATAFRRSSSCVRGFASVGDKIPAVNLHSGFPPKMIDLAAYSADKSILLVGLPGAFTPTIPSYKSHQDELRSAGIDQVIIWCVNDGAVMEAWADDQDVDSSSMIELMGDPAGELTEALDMKLTDPGPASVGIIGRCKRHAIYAVNGEIKAVHVSEADGDPAGDEDPSSTMPEAMLSAIQASK